MVILRALWRSCDRFFLVFFFIYSSQLFFIAFTSINSFVFVTSISVAVINSTDPSALEMFQDSNAMVNINHSPPNNGVVPVNVPQQEAPYVLILEHPAPKALRFRYECEGRSAGSIPGANSTTDNKTYPTIQVVNYVGRAVVVVSCVTKDFPYK